MGHTYPTVSRVAGDETPISFSWPDAGSTVTGTRSIDGGAQGAVVGAIAFAETVSGVHIFRIVFSAADRPAGAGSVLFTLTDGTTTRVLPLVVHAAADCGGDDDDEPGEVAPLLDADAIGEAMAGPELMTVDGNTYKQHRLTDQIAADKYRRSLIEAEKPLSKRLRLGVFVPPGTT